jgi:mono/diheme cytochrome c family protein
MKTQYAAAVLTAGLVAGFLGHAQSKQATVLDGVYTEQQAQRGAEQYDAICASCHEGDEPEANSPKGLEFVERWREAPVNFLYQFIRTNMPGNKPGSLTEANYIDLVAYLLQANGYPAGKSELSAAKVGNVWLVGTGGPAPLPANALVRAIGCLATNPENDWILSGSANPVRVRTADQTTPEEIAASAATPLGQSAYKLINAEDFQAPKLKGQKVQVKGVLTKVANPYTLTVLSLERAGTSCEK